MDPATAAARSDRMSPNRFEARMTSTLRGLRTSRAASASIRTFSSVSPVRPAAVSSTTWSQNGMVWMIPLDLVAEIRWPVRRIAWSMAYSATRVTPARVNTASWRAISPGCPRWMRPPTSEYSPSVFSRTTRMSTWPASASGEVTPGRRRTGRRFTYWSKWRRIGISRPHRDASSAMSGVPTAPRRMASPMASWPIPSAGIIRPWRR